MQQRFFVANKAIIVNDKGNILILRESDDEIRAQTGKWGLPGGRMEFGEHPQDALKREVKEETGLDVDPVRPVHVDEWQPKVVPDEAWQIVGIFYLCTVNSVSEVSINEEFDAYSWVDATTVKEYVLMEADKKAILQYVRNK